MGTMLGAYAILILSACAGATQAPLVPTSDSVDEAPEAVPHDVEPRLINAREVQELLRKRYPSKLREKGIGGAVDMFVFVNRQGRVTDVRPRTSSSHPEFNRAAESVFRAMKFTPAEADGEPIGIWTVQQARFTMR